MRIKRAFTASLFAIGALAGCSSGGPALRIGVNDWPPCELWYVAQSQGYFGNVPVEIVRFTSWFDNMSALYKGNLDVTHATYFNAVYFSDKGVKGKIILVSDTVVGGDGLAVSPAIARGEDLRGKRIAVEVNTDEHFLLRKALEDFGLREEDVTVVATTSAAARDLLAKGEADACFTYEPYLSDAATAAGGRIVWTTRDKPGYMIDVLVAADSALRGRMADLEVILRAWYRAQQYVAKHPDEAFALMGQNEGMSAQDFGPFYGSFTFFSAEGNRRTLDSQAFRDRLQEMGSFLVSHKGLSAPPAIGGLYDPRLVRRL